jgi:hypothetical protein
VQNLTGLTSYQHRASPGGSVGYFALSGFTNLGLLGISKQIKTSLSDQDFFIRSRLLCQIKTSSSDQDFFVFSDQDQV